ncbi:PilZ domain-containing protein [Novosphingobium sp.]|uniref:PilZ domain-containing protein n=1 Tax=Novosphingobium sp. TaxID=1874826 RepID=UPI0025D6E785|nr:PilZ domain-containing protein [Novosphingobium sp.]
MPKPQRDPDQTTRGRRRYGRLRLRLRARLITIHGTASGVLADLSVTGARVLLHEPLPSAGDALLQWEGNEAFGMIVWVHGCECGVLFDEPLPEALLLGMRDVESCPDEREQARTAAAVFVSGRPGFAPEPRMRALFGKR